MDWDKAEPVAAGSVHARCISQSQFRIPCPVSSAWIQLLKLRRCRQFPANGLHSHFTPLQLEARQDSELRGHMPQTDSCPALHGVSSQAEGVGSPPPLVVLNVIPKQCAGVGMFRSVLLGFSHWRCPSKTNVILESAVLFIDRI